MNSLLTVKDLNVTFKSSDKKLHAVRGVSFSLGEQETLGVVGESGCGKSAMAKALIQLLPFHHCEISGQVLFNGEDLLGFNESQMRRIRGKEVGTIFQDPMTSLNPTMKIGTQIKEALLRHNPSLSYKEAWEKAVEMLEMVGIPYAKQRVEEYPHTLSGGMRQRVMIALALACTPFLLIADEPTTSLDVTIQAQILELMKSIQSQLKMSILLITHDLSLVAGFCDRVLVMYAGQIVESATVEQLFSAPKHPYTQRLLQAIPRLDMPKDRPLLPIEGAPPLLSHPLKGCSFCARCTCPMNICQLTSPPNFELEPGHTAVCWNYDPRKKHD